MYVPYCTSDGYSGRRDASDETGGLMMAFTYMDDKDHDHGDDDGDDFDDHNHGDGQVGRSTARLSLKQLSPTFLIRWSKDSIQIDQK